MTTSHTPGPWFVEVDHASGEPEFVRAHHDGEMLDVASLLVDETGSAAANARLIAAAPNLLEALRLLAEGCTRVMGQDSCGQDYVHVRMAAIEKARAAIAAATGKA